MGKKMIPPETIEQIDRILRQGNDVELKKVNGKIHVVEVKRKIVDRTTFTTG